MNAAKGSGGVGLFLKERITLEYKIDIIDNLVDGILGIKFTNKLTFVVFSCYLPPESSPWCLNALSFFWDNSIASTSYTPTVDAPTVNTRQKNGGGER